MRALVAGLISLAVVVGSPAPAAAEVQWRPQTRSAAAYAHRRLGSVGFAVVSPDGSLRRHRGAVTVPAASVVKVMFAVAYLRQPSVRSRDLIPADRALLGPMIRRSDNDAATRIADRLGPLPMYRLARTSGMRHFSYTRPWGRSTTSARDQALFLHRLEDHLPRRHRAYALRLLADIVGSQRWGIARIDTPGWSKHFKGGWGSGTGAVDHQVVLLRRRDGSRVAVAVTTTSSPSHRYGKRTLRGVFARLLADLP